MLAELYEHIEMYHPSEEIIMYITKHPPLFVAGPTGAGKDTLSSYLAKTSMYAAVVSDTTRAPRPHLDGLEVNGLHYWFLTEEQMLEKIKRGAYVEVKAVHKERVYGTSFNAYKTVVESGRTPILEIDVQGVEDIISYFSDLHAVLLLPPNFEVWQDRLDRRGDMALDEKLRRLETALDEINKPIENIRFLPVVNTEVVTTAQVIISGEYKNETYRQKALAVARQLLHDTQQYIGTH